LIDTGYVAENKNGKIIATFSIDNGRTQYSDTSVLFFEGNDEALSFSNLKSDIKSNHTLLIFKKLAVDPNYAKLGLGSTLFNMAEQIARDNGYEGMILETVLEAHWLYEWYRTLGFIPVGKYRYPNSQVETVLMIKCKAFFQSDFRRVCLV
jgi:GNAT superfamily N-acetyltransferase